MVIIKHIKASSDQLIGRAYTAELTSRGRIEVRQIAARGGYVRIQILAAGLSGRWVYCDEFDRRAVDLLSADG
jgi:hypothetical protein